MEESADILIVDDASINRDILANILEHEGYTVRSASSGEAALRDIDSALPELILMDIRMPGIDGYETCQRLKSGARTRDIPVIH